MINRARELSGLVGGLLWLASWLVSAGVAFGEGTGYGWTFLIVGVTGPVAGIATGLVWGNWIAFLLGAVGWGLIATAPNPFVELRQPIKIMSRRGSCGFYAELLEAERERQRAELLANPPWWLPAKP